MHNNEYRAISVIYITRCGHFVFIRYLSNQYKAPQCYSSNNDATGTVELGHIRLFGIGVGDVKRLKS